MTRVGSGDWYDPTSSRVAIAARRIFFRALDDEAPGKRRNLLESVVPLYQAWRRHPFYRQRLWTEGWAAMMLEDLIERQPGEPPDYRRACSDVIEALFAWATENELPADPRRNPTTWPLHVAFHTVDLAAPMAWIHPDEWDWDKVMASPWSGWPHMYVHEGIAEDFTVVGWEVAETWNRFEARVSDELARYKASVSDDRRARGMKPIPELRAAKGARDADYHRKARWLVRFHVLNENQEDIAEDEGLSPRRVREGCREFGRLIDLPAKTRRSRKRRRG